MATDKPLEIRRQLVHLLLGLSIAVSVYILEPIYGKLIVWPLIIAILIMFILPEIGAELHIHNHLLFHFERPKDIAHFPYRGAITYGIGIIPTLLLLDVNTACAIIFILSVGDSVSTLVGKFYGRHRIGHKSLEGFLAFVFFSVPGAWFFLPNALEKALLLSTIGGLLELSNIYHDHVIVDDNLLVPIGLTMVALLI